LFLRSEGLFTNAIVYGIDLQSLLFSNYSQDSLLLLLNSFNED